MRSVDVILYVLWLPMRWKVFLRMVIPHIFQITTPIIRASIISMLRQGVSVILTDACPLRKNPESRTMIWFNVCAIINKKTEKKGEYSDSEKNMSAYADQNHAPSLMCVRVETKGVV